jgi:cytochrome c556
MSDTRTPPRRIALGLAALTLAVTFAAGSGAGRASAAAPDAQSAILARQAGFKKMGTAMKALGGQLKSGAPDKAVMAAAAATILATARTQGALFPAGSGPTAGVKTDALPAIWTDKATFDGDMAALVTESGKLVATINSGASTDAILAQTKAVGGTCGACHRAFRQDT